MSNTLSYDEFKAVKELSKLADNWPAKLWLLGQSGALYILRAEDERPFYWNAYNLKTAVENLHFFTNAYVVDPAFEKRYAKESSETQRALAFAHYLIGEIVNEVTDGNEFNFAEIIRRGKEVGIDVEQDYLEA